MRIERDEQAHDAWVEPRAVTATDLGAWRTVVQCAYGIRAHTVIARDDQNVIRGALCLYDVKHPIFGHHLTTAAFANDGGFYAETERAADALVGEAKRLTDVAGASHCVIRKSGADLKTLAVDHRYLTAQIDLVGDLWKRIPSKTRNQVRRGQKEGFTIDEGDVHAFYDVFHTHMRDLGSPAHSLRYYELIKEHLGEHARFIVVRDGRRVVAGAMLLSVNDTASNLHTVALREMNRRCPNYLLYWYMLETSAARGYKRFDMGRSVAGGNNLSFKENWGPTTAPLSYNFYLRTLTEVPFADPRNVRYRLPILVWQRLPVGLTKIVGPRLIAGLT